MISYGFAALEDAEDSQLLTRIYQRYYHKMMAVALQILSSRTKAEDAVHEAFLKAMGHMEALRRIPEERQGCWMLTVTKNAALDLLRKEGRELPAEDMTPLVRQIAPDEGEFRRLVALIRELPESYRRVLELRFVAEWSYEEIARALHISQGAVKTRVSRGRQLLIQRMREEGYPCG